MELNFSKKTRKIVASLLAVAILLGVLPVSGLTGNSSGAESNSSENSTKTIYVNSTKQPILFDSVGEFKEIIPKVKNNIYSTQAVNGDKIALFTNIGEGNSVVSRLGPGISFSYAYVSCNAIGVFDTDFDDVASVISSFGVEAGSLLGFVMYDASGRAWEVAYSLDGEEANLASDLSLINSSLIKDLYR